MALMRSIAVPLKSQAKQKATPFSVDTDKEGRRSLWTGHTAMVLPQRASFRSTP